MVNMQHIKNAYAKLQSIVIVLKNMFKIIFCVYLCTQGNKSLMKAIRTIF